MWYLLIGLSYWAINLFVRKLHRKNEPEDGWFLSILWVFFWPLCLIALLLTRRKEV